MIQLRGPIAWEDTDYGLSGSWRGRHIIAIEQWDEKHYRISLFNGVITEMSRSKSDQAKARAEELLLEFGEKVFTFTDKEK